MSAGFCGSCGAVRKEGAAFCASCGARFEGAAVAGSPPPPPMRMSSTPPPPMRSASPPPPPAMTLPGAGSKAKAAGPTAARAVGQAAKLVKTAGNMKALTPPRWNVVVGETLPPIAQILKAKAGEVIRSAVAGAAEQVKAAAVQAVKSAVVQPPPASPASGGAVCPRCGAAWKSGAAFCGQCGNRTGEGNP